MSGVLDSLWENVCWYAAWYADWVYQCWIHLSPMGYVAICFACLTIGWIFLKSGTKSFGR
ncbi:hypothetical protein [Alienimonas chondri]|uniref:Uncharacterized protein n=1 Tax=Alienimonas chondri TaxID=2681879 RepID=A0ABX1V9K4_9PLAN|nr:hypothetical protein [Alienimonas chondri]NNJ24777.1 hypothetical protein [Alienimonas chondri]